MEYTIVVKTRFPSNLSEIAESFKTLVLRSDIPTEIKRVIKIEFAM